MTIERLKDLIKIRTRQSIEPPWWVWRTSSASRMPFLFSPIIGAPVIAIIWFWWGFASELLGLFALWLLAFFIQGSAYYMRHPRIAPQYIEKTWFYSYVTLAQIEIPAIIIVLMKDMFS